MAQMNYGSDKITDVYLGSSKLNSVYHGSTKLWPNEKTLPTVGGQNGSAVEELLSSYGASISMPAVSNPTVNDYVMITAYAGRNSPVDFPNWGPIVAQYSINNGKRYNANTVIYRLTDTNIGLNGSYSLSTSTSNTNGIHATVVRNSGVPYLLSSRETTANSPYTISGFTAPHGLAVAHGFIMSSSNKYNSGWTVLSGWDKLRWDWKDWKMYWVQDTSNSCGTNVRAFTNESTTIGNTTGPSISGSNTSSVCFMFPSLG